MNIEHDSHNIFYRDPFGAVTTNEKIHIRLSLSGAGIPSAIVLVLKKDGEDNFFNISMSYIHSVAEYSVYEAVINTPQKECLLWYYFKIETNGNTYFYGNNIGNTGGKGHIYEDIPKNLYQITVYSKNYKTPDWFKNSVAYQIFPDRFFNGCEDGKFLGNRTDIIKRKWGETPYYKAEQFGGEYLCNDFFGGNLKGIIKKLPYLKDLGIDVIYLNPIFKAYSNHKYDTGSYEEIDPSFGDEETFKTLCHEAKKNGIKIILDGVFNHTGSNSMYFNKNGEYDTLGAYQSKKSPYYSWYRFFDFPDDYESWWGIKTLPQTEENSKDFRKYILSGKNAIIKKWLRNGAYGWRLDVADELPDSFIEEMRKNVKKEKKDAVIIGEVWEDASNKISYGQRKKYFLGHELDSVMNYPLKNYLTDILTGKTDAEELNKRILSIKENYPPPSFYSLLNIMSSHDSIRILSALSGRISNTDDKEYQASFKLEGDELELSIKKLEVMAAFIMTFPGVPCIFYGDETGTQGGGDPFCRSCFDWDKIYNNNILSSFKYLIKTRKISSAFSTGEFEPVYYIGKVYAYIRNNKNKKYLVILNFGSIHENIRIDIARFDVKLLKNIKYKEKLHSENGIFLTDIEEYNYKIFECF